MSGKIDTIETGTDVIITLNADTGTISAGGKYQGAFQLQGNPGQSGELFLLDEAGHTAVVLKSKPRRLFFQAAPGSGQIPVGRVMVLVDGETPDLRLFGSSGDAGGEAKDCTVHLRGSDAVVRAGGNGVDGRMLVLGNDAKARIALEGNKPELYLSGSGGTASGANGATVHLRGSDAVVRAGGNGVYGRILVLGADTKATISLEGDTGTINLQSGGKQRILIDPSRANLWLGGNGADGDLLLFRQSETATGDRTRASIHLNGEEGDIILRNADCAEEFDLAQSEKVEPGTVMVLDTNGQLRTSTDAFDPKVVGVVSGAGDFKPGIILDRRHPQDKAHNRVSLALLGKVYCKADAQYGAIEPGDLLTSSPTPGHAMKTSDLRRAFGAVIGKALRPLTTGQGLVPMLIALQ